MSAGCLFVFDLQVTYVIYNADSVARTIVLQCIKP
jgi:hypothetical protein